MLFARVCVCMCACVQARTQYQLSLRHNPTDTGVLNNFASLLLGEFGDVTGAEQCFVNARKRTHFVRAWAL